MKKVVWFPLVAGAMLVALGSTSGCSVGYLAVQGYYGAQLLTGREPIEEVQREEDLPAPTRESLTLIQQVRAFGETHLGLTSTDNYTTINRSWDRTIYNVSASQPLRFEAHTWWFPIVGDVPYKGYFQRSHAERERDALKARGLDVVMQQVAGFSTLGFFSDPVLPHMLAYEEADLVNLILHELAHATVYFKGKADFNESLATFVGDRGTLEYLTRRDGAQAPSVRRAAALQADDTRAGAFMWQLYQELDGVYRSAASDPEKATRKAELLAAAPERWRQTAFETERYQRRDLGTLNNANLMAFARYNASGADFEVLLAAVGGDWERFFEAIKGLEAAQDPFEALRSLPEQFKKL